MVTIPKIQGKPLYFLDMIANTGLAMEIQDSHLFQDLFDTVNQFLAVLDKSGHILRLNKAALELTQLTEAQTVGQPLWKIPWHAFPKNHKKEFNIAVKQALQGDSQRLEVNIPANGRSPQTLEFTFTPIGDATTGIKFVIVAGVDISLTKRASAALIQSNKRFAAIFQRAGLGILIKGPDGKILESNPAFLNMLGYRPEELLGKEYLEITHPADRAISRKLFTELQEGKRETYYLEKRYLTKDHEIVWASVNASLVLGLDQKVQFTIVMVENITSHKQTEAELIEVQHRLMHGREMERLKIAQDLHDGPLQEVIGISFQLKELETALPAEAGREQLQAALTAIQQVAKSIRTVCSELRPSTLMPFGLEKAILSHSGEFQAIHPQISLDLTLQADGQLLNQEIRIALFRIYQEALNNILRHSHASRAWVHFWLDEEEACLEIKDNGQGFKPPEHWIELARRGHLGLVGAIERARDVGGRFEIHSTPGEGTTLRAVIPTKIEVNTP